MQAIYKAKHFNEILKSHRISKMITCITLLIILAFSNISEIFAFFTSSVSVTNIFSMVGTYTVHYDANSGTGTMSDQVIFRNVATALKENSYTKISYKFIGWNTAANGSGTGYTDEEVVTNLTSENSTITLYAQWEEILGAAEIDGTYYDTLAQAIQAVPSNNTTPVTIKVLHNLTENVSIPSGKKIIIDLQGYTVSNGSNGSVIENNGNLVVTNGTLTKDPTATHAVINNNASGVLEVRDATIDSKGSAKSQAIYNAGGNVTISGNSVLSSESTNRATVHNLLYQGSLGKLTITGGTIISKNLNAVVNEGGEVTIGTEGSLLDTTSPTIQGKSYGVSTNNNKIYFYDGTLKGYSNAINNESNIHKKESGCSYLRGTEVIDELNYKTLTLEPNNTITFNPTGGTVSETEKYYDTNDVLGTLPVPTKTGHRFDGWFTLETGGTQVDATTTVTGSTTYYAHWTELKEVRFDASPGITDETVRYVETGAQIGQLPTATQTGFRFDGWFTDPQNGTQIDATTTINQDVTFYAHWTEVYTVHFNPAGGTVSETERQVEHGEEIGALPTPTKPQNTFLGWFTALNGGQQISANTVVTGNDTYYAHWSGVAVARINGIDYPTLQAAITAADDNTATTIELLTDISEHVTVPSSKNITLDLGNYTISSSREATVIVNAGTLTISNGTLTSSAGYAVIDNNTTGHLIITGGNIIATGLRQAIYNEGTLEISGNAYLSSGPNVPTNDRERGTVTNYKGTTTITGGTIVADKIYAVYVQNGTTTIGSDDGTVSNSSPVFQGTRGGIKNDATLKFYDGIVRVPTSKSTFIGNINDTPDGYAITQSTTVIDGVTYKTGYLDNTIALPTAKTGLIYNGTAQNGVNANSNACTVSGGSATSAGTHTATVSLKYPSISTWSDGTTSDKTVTYTIDKATLTPELTADNKVYDGTTTATGTITLQGVVGSDTLTATATSIDFASANVGTGITVTATGITVSGTNASNYDLSFTTATSTADITSE